MCAGARVDVRQLQTNPVDYPVELRVTGLADINALDEAEGHRHAALDRRQSLRRFCELFRNRRAFAMTGGRMDFEVTLKVDPDRANMAGVTNQDVAQSSSAALSGASRDHAAPRRSANSGRVALAHGRARHALRHSESVRVFFVNRKTRCPLLEVSKIENELQTLRIRRLEHFRTISVQSFTIAGSSIFGSIFRRRAADRGTAKIASAGLQSSRSAESRPNKSKASKIWPP